MALPEWALQQLTTWCATHEVGATGAQIAARAAAFRYSAAPVAFSDLGDTTVAIKSKLYDPPENFEVNEATGALQWKVNGTFSVTNAAWGIYRDQSELQQNPPTFLAAQQMALRVKGALFLFSNDQPVNVPVPPITGIPPAEQFGHFDARPLLCVNPPGVTRWHCDTFGFPTLGNVCGAGGKFFFVATKARTKKQLLSDAQKWRIDAKYLPDMDVIWAPSGTTVYLPPCCVHFVLTFGSPDYQISQCIALFAPTYCVKGSVTQAKHTLSWLKSRWNGSEGVGEAAIVCGNFGINIAADETPLQALERFCNAEESIQQRSKRHKQELKRVRISHLNHQ